LEFLVCLNKADLDFFPAPGIFLDEMEPGTMQKRFTIYILASKRNGTLYIGVTSDLAKRVWEHKNHLAEGFTRKYGVDRLVYYETHETAESAIAREKKLKKWNRAWKIRLIEKDNPNWHDLYEKLQI